MPTRRPSHRPVLRPLAVGVACLAALLLCRLPVAAAATATPTLLAASSVSNAMTSYPLSDSGDAAPAVTLSGGDFDRPEKVALDSAGDLWVANALDDTVTEYTQSQVAGGGDPIPVFTLAGNGSPDSLDLPLGLAFDAAGDLWVSNVYGTVVEYTSGQLAEMEAGGSNELPPAVVIGVDAGSGLPYPSGLAFDSAGDLWVADLGNATVAEYSSSQLTALEQSGSGSPAPAVTLGSDSSYSLGAPDAVVFDAAGDLWVVNSVNIADFNEPMDAGSSVSEFTPGQLTASGDPDPKVMLDTTPSTDPNYPNSLMGAAAGAFDSSGDLWVTVGAGGADAAGAVVEFTPSQLGASGEVEPAAMISGDQTGLDGPDGLVIEQAPTVSGIAPDAGPAGGGTTVAIGGTGFYPGSTVEFGSTAATSVTYLSPYELKAVAPAGSGTVDVTVTTAQGTSATSAAGQYAYSSSAAVTPPRASSRPRIRLLARRLKVSKRRATIKLSCSGAACRGTVRLSERVTVRVRHGKRTVRKQRTVTLGSVRYTLTAGHRVTLRARLDATARRALARHHRLSARLAVTVRGGTTVKVRVTLIS